jgi:CRP-like cAMP-binding protein
LRNALLEAISRLHRLILNLGRTTAEEKVGEFLLKMSERLSGGPADRMVLPISREDIADYLALSVETVSRSLTRLNRRGVILLMGRRISIIDRNRLGEANRHDPATIPDECSANRPYSRALACIDHR